MLVLVTHGGDVHHGCEAAWWFVALNYSIDAFRHGAKYFGKETVRLVLADWHQAHCG